MVQGLDTVPADDNPTLSEVNTVHLAWDVMVGLGTLLFLLSSGTGCAGCSAGTCPRAMVPACSRPRAGVAAVVTMEAGWVVSEVGRQPWIVYNLMKVEDAATGNTGVWITFVVVTRAVPRPRGHDGADPAQHEPTVPRPHSWRPRGAVRPERTRPRSSGRGAERMSTADAVVLMLCAVTAYAVFGGADFGAGSLGPGRRWRPPRRASPRSHRPLRSRPVWEANHVWLIFIFVVLWTGFPEAYASITLTLFVPLTLAALGIVLRGSSFAFRKQLFSTRDRRFFGAGFALSSVLVPYCLGAIAGGIASGEVPRVAWLATPGAAGSTRPRSSPVCSPSRLRPTWPPYSSWLMLDGYPTRRW